MVVENTQKNLICQNILEKEGPHINKILDDNAIDGQTLAGIPVIKTSDFDFSKESIIFISSDSFINNMTENLKRYAKSNIKNLEIINIPSLEFGIKDLKTETLYEAWINNNYLSKTIINELKSIEKELAYRPKISVIMPVWNTNKKWLVKAIDSVRCQIYSNWELCITDDCSSKKYLKPFLEKLTKHHKNIKVHYNSKNENISLATNRAVSLATGEYLVFLDHDDELTKNALLEIIISLNSKKSDIIYSDNDNIDEKGNRYNPQFKPAWSPEMLLSYQYMCHLICMKKSLYEKVGGCRKGFEGCQDYDLLLRATENSERIIHIPKILYHWRAIKGSTALSGDEKPEAFEIGIKTVQEALNRRNLKGKVFRPKYAIERNLGIFNIDWPNTGPKVSILIPTKDNLKYLSRCISSLEKTKYDNFEVIIIDNDSKSEQVINYLENVNAKVIKIKNKHSKFSFSYINNEASKEASGQYLLFLNDDTEVINKNWLSALVGYIQISGVGITGSKLLYSNKNVQHGGVALGFHNGLSGHSFKNLRASDLGYMCQASVTRNTIGVTGACLLTSKELFEKLSRFDETLFNVAYQDIDYCIRANELGYRSVYVPDSLLYHHEGTSRGFNDDIDEVLNFKNSHEGKVDPYLNINISREYEEYIISPECTLDHEVKLKNKINLVLVSHNFNLEGAPLQLFEIGQGLKEQFSVEVIIISPLDGPLRQLAEDNGLQTSLFESPLVPGISKTEYIKKLKLLTSYLKNSKADLVISNTLNSFFATEAAYAAKCKSIWFIHESIHDYQSYFSGHEPIILHKSIEAFNYPNKVVFCSNATKRLYRAYDNRNNFITINNSISLEKIKEFCNKHSKQDCKKQLNLLKEDLVITIIGTVCPRKGQLDFVKAAQKVLKRTNKSLKFIIVGARYESNPDYHDKIYKITKKFKDNIIVVNETKNVNQYYRASDIFVCCSNNESYPRVILEAMAFNLAIITTPVYGVTEQVLENVNALYFTPGNDKELKKQIIRLTENVQKLKSLQKSSYKVLQLKNHYERMVAKYNMLINNTIHFSK